jgi:hypothetical protein
VLLLKALIDIYKGKRKHIYSCFIEFSSAFDHVWHSGLIYKLYRSGVSSTFIKLLHNMYSNLNCCVKQGVHLSENFTVNKGTRQGCNMSPTLFKLYISDLENCFNGEKCDPIRIGT